MPEHISIGNRGKIESFTRIGEDVTLGVVVVDHDKCKGCGLCADACPASSLELVDKKSRMVEVLPVCMSCGDCIAICPEGAIELTEFIVFNGYFRYLDRGKPEEPRRF